LDVGSPAVVAVDHQGELGHFATQLGDDPVGRGGSDAR